MEGNPLVALCRKTNEEIASELVHLRFTSEEVIDQHNQKFEDYLKASEWRRASILKVLLWDEGIINETKYIDYHIEHLNQGFAPLLNLDIDLLSLPDFNLRECWATLSLPFDFLGSTFLVASTCYLSSSMRDHWERRLTRNIIWYITDLSSLSLTLEKLENNDQSLPQSEESDEAVVNGV